MQDSVAVVVAVPFFDRDVLIATIGIVLVIVAIVNAMIGRIIWIGIVGFGGRLQCGSGVCKAVYLNLIHGSRSSAVHIDRLVTHLFALKRDGKSRGAHKAAVA